MGLSERYSLRKQSERNLKLKQILAAVLSFSEKTLLQLLKTLQSGYRIRLYATLNAES
jgi:hypothetical protein